MDHAFSITINNVHAAAFSIFMYLHALFKANSPIIKRAHFETVKASFSVLLIMSDLRAVSLCIISIAIIKIK